MATKPRKASRRARTPPVLYEVPEHHLCREVVRYRALPYLRTAGVTSVGIGYKRVGRTRTGELSVVFTVRRKLARRECKSEGAVPLPASFALADGRPIRADVIERTYHLTHLDPADAASPPGDPLGAVRRARLDPVRPGSSVGHEGSGAGTIGAIVFGDDGTPFVLSNWHVLAGPGSAPGDPVAQPGPLDDSDDVADVLGRLERRHLSLAGDAAIATIEGRGFDGRIIGLDIVPRRPGVAVLNDRVIKSGRTTGVTRALVARSNVVVTVSYPQGDRDIGGFEIEADPQNPPGPGGITEEGDSGSLWLIDAPPPDHDIAVGLQVCGAEHPDEQKEIAFACNIHSVLARLGVSLVPPV